MSDVPPAEAKPPAKRKPPAKLKPPAKVKPQDTAPRSPLPQQRWHIRAPRAWLPAILGGAVGLGVGFAGWWFFGIPLVLAAPLMLLLGYLCLPPTIHLGLDERGVALIRSKWGREDFLWIPRDRLVRLEMRQGWLVAQGALVEQQGNLSWAQAAQQAGTTVPPWLNMHFQSGLAAQEIPAPIHLLDQHGRDKIDLWLYQQRV